MQTPGDFPQAFLSFVSVLGGSRAVSLTCVVVIRRTERKEDRRQTLLSPRSKAGEERLLGRLFLQEVRNRHGLDEEEEKDTRRETERGVIPETSGFPVIAEVSKSIRAVWEEEEVVGYQVEPTEGQAWEGRRRERGKTRERKTKTRAREVHGVVCVASPSPLLLGAFGPAVSLALSPGSSAFLADLGAVRCTFFLRVDLLEIHRERKKKAKKKNKSVVMEDEWLTRS